MPRVNDIYIEDGTIIFSNFSGNPERNYNNDTKRTVTFSIPSENKDALMEAGWHIRPYIPKSDPDADPIYLLEATIAYRTKDGRPKDPGIFIVKPDRLIHVTEDIVDQLDRMDIVKVDAVLGPSYWEFGGRKGIRPYVNKMYITVKSNPIEEKYDKYTQQMSDSMFPTDTEQTDLPFPLDIQ